MPKFKVIKEGVNSALIEQVTKKVEGYLEQLFDKSEIVKIDGLFSFSFGTATVNIRVIPFHAEDVLVEVFSYLADEVNLTPQLSEELLRLNSTLHFGSFGLTFDHSVTFSYSLAGANLDFNELSAALQTVATVADEYDELIKEGELMVK